MTNWVNIANSTIEPDAPLISSTMFALRDNPTAIAEGAAGAPRIQSAALAAGSVTNGKVANGTLGAEKFQTGTAERDWVLARTAAAGLGAVGTYAMLRTGDIIDQSTGVEGSTRAGSGLRYASADGDVGGTPSGTWRLMGRLGSTGSTPERRPRTSVWLRIS